MFCLNWNKNNPCLKMQMREAIFWRFLIKYWPWYCNLGEKKPPPPPPPIHKIALSYFCLGYAVNILSKNLWWTDGSITIYYIKAYPSPFFKLKNLTGTSWRQTAPNTPVSSILEDLNLSLSLSAAWNELQS